MPDESSELNRMEILLNSIPSLYLSGRYREVIEIIETIEHYDGFFKNVLSEKMNSLKERAQEMSEYLFIDELNL